MVFYVVFFINIFNNSVLYNFEYLSIDEWFVFCFFKIVKKKNKKGKIIFLIDFLVEDGGIGGGSIYVFKLVSWVDEIDDLEGDGNFFCIFYYVWNFYYFLDKINFIIMVYICNLKGIYLFCRILNFVCIL